MKEEVHMTFMRFYYSTFSDKKGPQQSFHCYDIYLVFNDLEDSPQNTSLIIYFFLDSFSPLCLRGVPLLEEVMEEEVCFTTHE